MPNYEEIIQQSQANVKALSEKLKALDMLQSDIIKLIEQPEKIIKLSEEYINSLGAISKNFIDENNVLFRSNLIELSTKIKEFEKEVTRLINTDFTKLFNDLQKVFIDKTREDLAIELKRFEEKSKDLQSKIDELKKQVDAFYTQSESESLASMSMFMDMFKEKADAYSFSASNGFTKYLNMMPFQIP